MKKILLVIVLLLITTISFCQFKVDNSGNISIGAATAKIEIKTLPTAMAQIRCDVLPILYFTGSCYSSGFNIIVAHAFGTPSDSTLKENIHPLKNTTSLLKQVNTYSYNFKADKGETRNKEFGVLAQEVEEILPELVITANEMKLVNYDGFIPLLIEALKEQQKEIEVLQKVAFTQEMDLVELRYIVNNLQDIIANNIESSNNLQRTKQYEIPQSYQKQAILYQNIPNPFSSNTEIICNLLENTKQAKLYIYNMQGAELKAYSLTQKGINTITIQGSELPAGMYLYTLVVDNEIVDSKRMILTK